MNPGFSYIGFLFLMMLMIPNIIWIKNKPKDYEKYVLLENKILLTFERAGEAAVTCVALIFRDFNLHGMSPWALWLVAAFILMLFYEYYWIRYFKSDQTMKDFYSSFLRVPVAGATLPVAAFLLLGVYGKNLLMIVSVSILGIGHIGIHLSHQKEIRNEANEK